MDTGKSSIPEVGIANDEIALILDDEITKLPIDLKTAIVLCDLEGLSQRQAAKRLGVASTTLSDRVTKGRKLLQRRLSRRGVALSLAGLATHFTTLVHDTPILSSTIIGITTEKALLFSAGQTSAEMGVSSVIVHAATEIVNTMKITKLASLLVAAVGIVFLGGFLFEGIGIQTVFGQTSASLVIPSDLSGVEGDSTGGINGTYRVQTIYDASQFGDVLTGSNVLKRWSHRPDVDTPAGHKITYERIQIRMSVTDVAPDDMSLTFSENISSPQTLVFDDTWTSTTQSLGAAGGPKEFDMHYDFTETFEYNPNEGNLLIDWTYIGGDVPIGIDTDSERTRFSTSVIGSIDEATGAAFWGPVPSQLTFVPEPSSVGVAAIGVAGVLTVFRKRLLFLQV